MMKMCRKRVYNVVEKWDGDEESAECTDSLTVQGDRDEVESDSV